jgi:hypothetical protein
MSPEAMQTALSVGAFNKEYDAQNAEHARKFGEADRRFDATGAELNKLRTNPEYRRERGTARCQRCSCFWTN